MVTFWHLGLQDGVSCTIKGEETHGCQIRGAAKMDSDAEFHPKGIAGVFQRGYYWDYKYVNVKKGNAAGVSMVLAAYVLFNYCCSYKELKHEQRRKHHWRGPSVDSIFLTVILAQHLWILSYSNQYLIKDDWHGGGGRRLLSGLKPLLYNELKQVCRLVWYPNSCPGQYFSKRMVLNVSLTNTLWGCNPFISRTTQ